MPGCLKYLSWIQNVVWVKRLFYPSQNLAVVAIQLKWQVSLLHVPYAVFSGNGAPKRHADLEYLVHQLGQLVSPLRLAYIQTQGMDMHIAVAGMSISNHGYAEIV